MVLGVTKIIDTPAAHAIEMAAIRRGIHPSGAAIGRFAGLSGAIVQRAKHGRRISVVSMARLASALGFSVATLSRLREVVP